MARRTADADSDLPEQQPAPAGIEPPPPAAPDYTRDPHWGRGGRYVIDPQTGARVPRQEGEQ